MRIAVHVKTHAKRNQVTKIDDATFRILTTASPIDGKANKAVVKLLAEYLDIPSSCIGLVKGQTVKQKIFRINPTPRQGRGGTRATIIECQK